MDIRKPLISSHAMTAFIMVVALEFPCVAYAVNLGEIVLVSKPGEALLAQVELMTGSSERLEDSCLSLLAPDPLQENASSFLTEADLSLMIDGKRQYVYISSHKPFNDASARLRLQIKCLGTRGVIKTLLISSPVQKSGKKQVYSASATPELSGESINESHIEKTDPEEIAFSWLSKSC